MKCLYNRIVYVIHKTDCIVFRIFNRRTCNDKMNDFRCRIDIIITFVIIDLYNNNNLYLNTKTISIQII